MTPRFVSVASRRSTKQVRWNATHLSPRHHRHSLGRFAWNATEASASTRLHGTDQWTTTNCDTHEAPNIFKQHSRYTTSAGFSLPGQLARVTRLTSIKSKQLIKTACRSGRTRAPLKALNAAYAAERREGNKKILILHRHVVKYPKNHPSHPLSW